MISYKFNFFRVKNRKVRKSQSQKEKKSKEIKMTDYTEFGWPSDFHNPKIKEKEIDVIIFKEPILSWVYKDISLLEISRMKNNYTSSPNYQLCNALDSFYKIDSSSDPNEVTKKFNKCLGNLEGALALCQKEKVSGKDLYLHVSEVKNLDIIECYEKTVNHFNNLYFESPDKSFLAFHYQVILKLLCELEDGEYFIAKLVRSLLLFIQDKDEMSIKMRFGKIISDVYDACHHAQLMCRKDNIMKTIFSGYTFFNNGKKNIRYPFLFSNVNEEYTLEELRHMLTYQVLYNYDLRKLDKIIVKYQKIKEMIISDHSDHMTNMNKSKDA